MNKYLEKWIENNNPYKESTVSCGDPYHFTGFSSTHYDWEEGARAMAKHLTSQSQTEETIDKFLQLYNEYCHIPSKQLIEFPTAKDYIIKKLNDEEKTSKED